MSAEMRKSSPERSESWTDLTPDGVNLMTAFWNHMGQRYGRSWFEQYGHTLPDAWRKSLMSMTPAEARAGIAHLAKRQDVYLPNLSQFEQSCIAALKANQPMSETHRAALPEPQSVRKEKMTKASQYCDEMRARLK